MNNFGFIATPNSITFTDSKGKTFTLSSSHENFQDALVILKKISNTEDKLPLISELENLIAPVKKIADSSEHIKVVNGVVFYKNNPINNIVTERIVWGIKEGFNMNPYIMFLENLMQNPSYRSVNQLYNFIETHKMGITDDGYILGYKRVNEDFSDIYTGKIDNSPGKYITMDRNLVSDDPDLTCHVGLHFCAFSYLPSFGVSTGNRTVIVKVNPKDIVCIPKDYNAAKARCCAYWVLSEYLDKHNILEERPVFNVSEFNDTPNDTPSDTAANDKDFGWSESESESGYFGWSESEEEVEPFSEIKIEETNTETTPLKPNRSPYSPVDIFNNGDAPNNIENLLRGSKPHSSGEY